MKNTKIMFAKSLGFMGLLALVLGAFLVPSYKANAQSSLPTVGISASPADICSGRSVELNWSSTNAPSVHIDNGIGYVNQSGSRNVSPTQTTTYTATATNGQGVTASASVMVVVTGPCTNTPAPTVNLSANPSSIASGSSSTLSWSSTNATSCTASSGANGWSGSKSTSGTESSGSLTGTTTYTITCTNSTGSATDSATVTVVPQVNNPTVSINANPSSVSYAGSSIITWSSANATTCNGTSGANGWSGLKATSGSFHTGSLSGSTTFGITCTNSTGSASDSTTVFVSGQPQNNPTVNITANPSSVSSGDASIVSWSSANATSCNATSGTNGWSGLKATSGSFHTGALYGSTTFGITCTNSTGSASDAVTIYVGTVINNPSVTTYAATNIGTNSATLNGYVTGGGSYATAWFQWGTSYSNLFTSTNQQYYGSGSSNFNAPIYGLSPNTTYYFRAVAQGTNGMIYGSILSFVTGSTIVVPPPVYNQTSVNLTADSTNLAYNGATFIRWNSTNASTCVASNGSLGWAGAKSTGPASFYTGAMTGSRTFTITCTGIYGSATDSVTVTVRPRVITPGVTPPPVSNLSSLLIVTSAVDRNQPILPTIDNTMPRPGDEINYTITYKNVGNASLTNLNLQIVLPAEVDYMFSSPSNPSIFGQTLMFNLGTLRANTEGEVTVRVRVRENIAPGTVLNFPATLTYTDANGQAQSVNANVTAEVYRDGESQGIFLGANVFGAGFLPNNLFGWLLLIILILLLVLLAKYLFGRSDDNRYVLAAAPTPHGNDTGYNAYNGHGTTTERTTTTTHH